MFLFFIVVIEIERSTRKVDLKKYIIDTIARLNHSRADREDGKRNNFKKRDEVRAAGAIMNAFRDGRTTY